MKLGVLEWVVFIVGWFFVGLLLFCYSFSWGSKWLVGGAFGWFFRVAL